MLQKNTLGSTEVYDHKCYLFFYYSVFQVNTNKMGEGTLGHLHGI